MTRPRTAAEKAHIMYVLSGMSRDLQEISRGVYRNDQTQIDTNVRTFNEQKDKLAGYCAEPQETNLPEQPPGTE